MWNQCHKYYTNIDANMKILYLKLGMHSITFVEVIKHSLRWYTKTDSKKVIEGLNLKRINNAFVYKVETLVHLVDVETSCTEFCASL